MTNALIVPTTPSGQHIIDLLAKQNKQYTEYDTVALAYTEGEDSGYISYNFTPTGIWLKLTDVDFEELKLDGIKIWATWEATFKKD